MATQLFDAVNNQLKNWWIPLLVGAVLIATGVAAFNQPQEAFSIMATLFSVSFIVSGILLIVFAFSNTKTLRNWGWILLIGIASLALGIALIQNNAQAEIVLSYFTGFFVLLIGVSTIATALDLKSYGIEYGGTLILGILGVVVAIYLLANYQVAGLTAFTSTALGLIIVGIGLIILSFDLRKVYRFPNQVSEDLKNRLNKLNDDIQKATDDLQKQIDNATANASKSTSDSTNA